MLIDQLRHDFEELKMDIQDIFAAQTDNSMHHLMGRAKKSSNPQILN